MGLNQVTVKLARHVLTNREVAIKVIDKKTMNQTSLNKLFREVRIMKLLHHPNVGKYSPNHRTHNLTTNSRMIFQSNYSKLLKLIEHFIWLWSMQMAERFLIIWWRMVEWKNEKLEPSLGKYYQLFNICIRKELCIVIWRLDSAFIQIQSRSMSDPLLSDIDFKNEMAWVWTTLELYGSLFDI